MRCRCDRYLKWPSHCFALSINICFSFTPNACTADVCMHIFGCTRNPLNEFCAKEERNKKKHRINHYVLFALNTFFSIKMKYIWGKNTVSVKNDSRFCCCCCSIHVSLPPSLTLSHTSMVDERRCWLFLFDAHDVFVWNMYGPHTHIHTIFFSRFPSASTFHSFLCRFDIDVYFYYKHFIRETVPHTHTQYLEPEHAQNDNLACFFASSMFELWTPLSWICECVWSRRVYARVFAFSQWTVDSLCVHWWTVDIQECCCLFFIYIYIESSIRSSAYPHIHYAMASVKWHMHTYTRKHAYISIMHI